PPPPALAPSPTRRSSDLACSASIAPSNNRYQRLGCTAGVGREQSIAQDGLVTRPTAVKSDDHAPRPIACECHRDQQPLTGIRAEDRKSTRLNSSHQIISY